MEAVAKAPADGYTLVFGTPAVAINGALYKKLSYDPLKDLAPISLMAWGPYAVYASATLPVNNMAEVFEEPQVIHRGLRVDMPHPLAGTVHTLANPMRFSRTKVEYRLAPPLLGEHTEEIMRDRLHLDADRIAELRKSGAI